jgi:uncharacterized protein
LTDALPASAAPPDDAAVKPFPHILPSIGWIVLYFVLQVAVTTLLLIIGGSIPDPGKAASLAENPTLILWGLVASAAVQLILLAIYLRRDGRWRALGLDSFGRMQPLTALGLAAGLIVAAMLFNFVYATYIIPGVPMQEEMAKILAGIPRTPLNIAAGFVAIAIAAPLVEELLFRGLLQNALARHLPVWGAILLSSLVFALVHLQPYAIPGLMSLSIAFGYLYHRTGSLRMNIALHMVNNAVALGLTQTVAT